METSITEATSAIMLLDKSASQQQQLQPRIDSVSSIETFIPVSTSDHSTAQEEQQQYHIYRALSETPNSMFPNDHSTPFTQLKRNHKGKTEKALNVKFS